MFYIASLYITVSVVFSIKGLCGVFMYYYCKQDILIIFKNPYVCFVSVYLQSFGHQMKAPVFRTRKVHPVMDIYCYEPVEFSVSLRRLWTTVCVSALCC